MNLTRSEIIFIKKLLLNLISRMSTSPNNSLTGSPFLSFPLKQSSTISFQNCILMIRALELAIVSGINAISMLSARIAKWASRAEGGRKAVWR